MKISDNTAISMPMRNLIGLIMAIGIGIFAYSDLTQRLTQLETARQLMEADLLKKAEQTPVNQELYMLIEFLAGQNEVMEKEIQSIESQDYIRNIIEKILRIEAKSYLPKRVDELAKKHNFTYQKLAIKNTKTRWGSCSFKNNINLSLHLMRLREELIDYVILHELVHTKVKNHSREFWTTLDIHCPKSKSLDRELKKYSLRFF